MKNNKPDMRQQLQEIAVENKKKSKKLKKDKRLNQIKSTKSKFEKEKKSKKLIDITASYFAKTKHLHHWYDLSNEEIAATGSNMLRVTYDFFDQIVLDFPQYMSCQVLGVEETGLEIREYWVKPLQIGKMRIAPEEINQLPTLLMITGQHGQERTAIINLMLILHELFYGKREKSTLSLLHATFHLRIIPCLNAWGVANNRRCNVRNVDLNRNFSVGWLQAQGNKGEQPLSEIGSRILFNWVKQHKEQTLCFLNMHDHSDLAVSWGCASHPMTQKILLHAFQHFSVWYHQHFEDPTPDISLTWLGIPRDGYSDKHIGSVCELPTLLFECPYIGHARISTHWRDVRLVAQQVFLQVLARLIHKYYNEI